MKSSYHILQVQQTFYNKIWLRLRQCENLKYPDNPEKIRKPDKFTENEIMISYLTITPKLL